MSKRFVTIFPHCQNVHLTKDLGQIPLFLHKNFGYDSSLICYRHHLPYYNLEGEAKGLQLHFIENKGRISFLEKSVLKYIYSEAKNIDVLNLYIFSKHAFVYGLLYKFLNPKGFLFLKLDGYNETFTEQNKITHSVNPAKNIVFKFLENKFVKKLDLLSIENTEGEELVKNKFRKVSHKTMYLPVGVNDKYVEEILGGKINTYAEKENIILTVGRIGEKIKNNEMMLRALTHVDMKDWKMAFVGPVNSNFEAHYRQFIQRYPGLRSKIEFTGEIHDRKTLYEWYNRSKVFCMTSLKESFCHSIVEALYFGNYIIGTDGIVSMKDISKNEQFGIILKSDDDKALADALNNIIKGKTVLEPLYNGIVNHSRENFVWTRIIDKVHQKICNK